MCMEVYQEMNNGLYLDLTNISSDVYCNRKYCNNEYTDYMDGDNVYTDNWYTDGLIGGIKGVEIGE